VPSRSPVDQASQDERKPVTATATASHRTTVAIDQQRSAATSRRTTSLTRQRQANSDSARPQQASSQPANNHSDRQQPAFERSDSNKPSIERTNEAANDQRSHNLPRQASTASLRTAPLQRLTTARAIATDSEPPRRHTPAITTPTTVNALNQQQRQPPQQRLNPPPTEHCQWLSRSINS
jgi:hypothetical protein